MDSKYIKQRGVTIQQILFMHPDKYFLDFIKEFLKLKGFDVIPANDCVAGFTLATKILPDLIILNKEFPNLDGKGFLTKKGHPVIFRLFLFSLSGILLQKSWLI